MRTRVDEIFHEVADLSAEARGRYFVEHEVDDETRAEVEALVVFDSDATDSLERDIGQVAHCALGRLEQGRTMRTVPAGRSPGTRRHGHRLFGRACGR